MIEIYLIKFLFYNKYIRKDTTSLVLGINRILSNIFKYKKYHTIHYLTTLF